jgi:hypothetical protein
VLIIAGICFVVLIALLMIAYGYYNDRIAPRNDVVFQIGERQYTYAYLETRVKSDVAQGRFDVRDTANGITATVARIQREELTRIIGRERGVVLTNADIDAGIRDDVGASPELSRNEMAPLLRDELLAIDLSLDDYVEIVEARVIEDKVREQLTADIPEEAEQVDLLYIEAGSQANALLALQALEEGTEFGEVAAMYSQDAATSRDGVLGWVPREALDPELAEAAFRTTGRSGIIETEDNFYIIEVLGKETRPIEPGVVENIGRDGFNELLEAAFDDTEFIYGLTERQILDLAGEIGGSFG